MKIEKYGLNPIPPSERTATWVDLFLIWAGVSICLPSFITGALLIPNFSWGEAMEINFLGNLAVGVLIVLGGRFGIQTGCPAVILGRHVFGYPVGHWLPTAALLLSTLGWYGVMTALTGIALDNIINEATGFSFPLLITLGVGFLNATTAIMGYQKIQWLNRFSVPLLGGFCAYVAVKLLSIAPDSFEFSYQPTGLLSYGEGIDLIIGGFLAGAFAASDFSRYARDNRQNWRGTLLGAFLVSFLLGMLGMVSVVVTGDWNPLTAVQNLGLGMPALLFILLASWTTNHNLLYSSGLALTNGLPRLGRWKSTLLCGAAGTGLAAAGVDTILQSWLIMLSCIFSPLLGVVMADIFLIRSKSGSAPVNIQAVLAAGAGLCLEIAVPPHFVSSFVGLSASFVVYTLLKIVFSRSGSNKAPPR
jgi:cytosine permease